jgi:hypothetical protein
MKHFKIFTSGILFASLLMACSGNIASTPGKDSSSSAAASDGGSGNDYYYELTTTSQGKNVAMNDLTKMFVSSKGDMRVEMDIRSSANGSKLPAPMIMIAHADKPAESISIDDSAKTYTINHLDSNDLKTGEKIQSSVTKISNETIAGFNCVHARIISKKDFGSLFSQTDTVDLWKSDDVPVQAVVKNLMEQFERVTGNMMYSADATAQLKQMGCTGFTVKMQMHAKDYSMVMQLTKVERPNIPPGMFEIPAEYKEDKNGM